MQASRVPDVIAAGCLIIGLLGLIFWISDALNNSRHAKGREMTPYVGLIICLIGVMIFAVWAYSSRSTKSESAHAPGPSTVVSAPILPPAPSSVVAPPPAFELSDNAKLDVEGTAIVADPRRIVRASGNAQAKITGGINFRKRRNYHFSCAHGDLTNLSKDELRAAVKQIASTLRQFQNEMNEFSAESMQARLGSTALMPEQRKVLWEKENEKTEKQQIEYDLRFKTVILPTCTSITSELIRRLGVIRLPTNISSHVGTDNSNNQRYIFRGAQIVRDRKFSWTISSRYRCRVHGISCGKIAILN